MNILIADDHDLLRESLGAILTGQAGAIVAYASDLPEALDQLEDRSFDLVLLDYSMPGMDGYAGLERAIGRAGKTPVALMSGTAPADAAFVCIDAGGAGFIPKTMPARSFLNAVRFMAAGEKYLPPHGARSAMASSAAAPFQDVLTERERQVLQELCHGLSNKEIARKLSISEPTVKVHAQAVFRKIGARNRTHAAMLARGQGF